MHASQFYIFLFAILATSAAANSFHDAHWSRRSHKALARAKPLEQVGRSTEPQRRTARRRSCKPPASSALAGSAAAPSSLAGAKQGSAKAASSVGAPLNPASSATIKSAASQTQKSATNGASSGNTSKTAASSKPTSTGSSSPGGGGGGGGGDVLSLNALFPAGTPGKSWTTSPKSSSAISLSDNTLKPTKLLKDLSHTFMSAPDGKQAMQAIYPKGSYTFTHTPRGGFSFYAPGPDSLDMTTAKTLTFGYSVFFEDGFDFNKGGKLPGLYGGNSLETATGCSGGRRSTECYSARLMWRTGGMGEMYTYLPNYEVSGFAANKAVCNVAPESDCNPTYGASVGRGAFTFPTGKWTTVAERVQLNDVGKANGAIELWVNGKSVISVDGLILRDSAAGRHRGIQFQTFFGGSQPEWASPKTQKAYFSDFSVALIESL